MRKTIALALAVLMLGVATPAASAETVNRTYTLALGYNVEDVDGSAIIICLGPPEQEICEENDIAPIGGYDGRRTAAGVANQVVVSIVDDVFDQTYTSVCVYTDDHSICDDAVGDVFGEGCGSLLLAVPTGITTANPIAGFVYNVAVMADTDLCLGSSGTEIGATLTFS